MNGLKPLSLVLVFTIAVAVLGGGLHPAPAHGGPGDPGGPAAPAQATPTDSPSVVAPGAEFEQLATGYHFTEGPAPLPDGGLYFTDVFDPNDATFPGEIYHWSPGEGATLHRAGTSRTNGLALDADGNLVGCEWYGRRVVRDDREGNVEVLAERYDGGRLNGPNDVWIDPDGGIYFTDPVFGEPPGSREQDGQYVYYLPPDGGALVRASDALQYPNGLIGTPDGQTLYVTDSAQPTWRYDIEPDGTLTGKTMFTQRGGDGMTLDERGNVYLASQYDVFVYDAEGNQLETIRPPEPPSNMAFGGADGRTLFITAGTSVYGLEMAVRGAFAPGGGEATPTTEPTSGTPTATPTPPNPVPPFARPKRLRTGFTFTEGPAVDRNGDLYFTDVPDSEIYRLGLDDDFALVRSGTGRANGLYFDAEWNLVSCEGGNRRVTRDDRSGNLTTLADSFDGQRLNAPNDLWIDPDGGIYFTDPQFNSPTGGSAVYYLPAGSSNLMKVIDDLALPNGVIGTPDGQTLYVSDYAQTGKTWRYDIGPDGSLSGKSVFLDQSGDGMTLDEYGNVYVASREVVIVSSDGTVIDTIDVPEQPSNMTFGGLEGRTLYITAVSSVYAMDLNVRGAYAPEITVPPTPTDAPTATPTDTPTPTMTPDVPVIEPLYCPDVRR